MSKTFHVSTPSRLCLFGEHQDYLGLEVIAAAIDLRFTATVSERDDSLIQIAIRDSRLDRLDSKNEERLYEHVTIDLAQPIVYESKRDYLKSSVNVLLKAGYNLHGFDLRLDSEIPIGKGMCSSSTMIVVLIKALLEGIGHPDKDNRRAIAELAFQAEVAEFHEPGGRMDHYTSAIGGMVHLNFEGAFHIAPLEKILNGVFILFDSLEQKKTTEVLAASKIPSQEALRMLASQGVSSIRDFIANEDLMATLDLLDEFHRGKLQANIDNFQLLREGLQVLEAEQIDDARLGSLIDAHHARLRDGLGISTPVIEKILAAAKSAGAWGGKVNGSGGGGCCFVYADPDIAGKIISAVEDLGYPARLLHLDSGVRRDT